MAAYVHIYVAFKIKYNKFDIVSNIDSSTETFHIVRIFIS